MFFNKSNEVNNLCCVFNLAAHYRAPIYKLIDRHFNCHFYITVWDELPFKQMNYLELKGFKKTSRKISIWGNFYWQKGNIILAFKNYTKYIITGDPYSLSTWPLLILLKLSGKEVYLWSHGWYGDESKLKVYIKKAFFSLATKTFLYGDYARKLMIEQGFDPNNLTCIYNSLDYDNQIKIRKRLKSTGLYFDYFKNEFPVLLYIGRIQKVKKIDLLLQSIKILKAEGYPCNMIIIGNETDEVDIKTTILNFGLKNNVWLFGACYEEKKIGELIYNADLCVSPGNVGLTAMHSLVYGTPVLTHNNFSNQMPEFEAIREGITGGFFKEGSIGDLIFKIKYWISLTVKEREKVRQNCYKIIEEKYNPNVQIKILKDTINQL